MHVISTLSSALLLLGSSIVAGAPAIQQRSCTSKNIAVRHEWRALSKADRLAYISAIKCMMSKPSQTSAIYGGVRSRYDDFQALHIQMTTQVHYNGPFLPWHRWLLKLWETDLQTTCGYTGTQPYWDFSLDNTMDTYLESPLFDEVYGFGGDGAYIANYTDVIEPPSTVPIILSIPVAIPGRLGGGCLENGPFANHTVNMGPGASTDYAPHCLRRDMSPTLVTMTMNNTQIARTLAAPTFQDLNIAIQGTSLEVSGMTLHGGLHIGIGGQIGEQANMFSSPGDPLFWFIHASLDRVWDKWQREDFTTRVCEVEGPDVMWGYPFDFFGPIPYNNITLEYILQYPHIGANVSIGSIMDTASNNLCYKYV